MRQEHVTLHNVQISQLYDLIKEYLKGLKLDIIHEEKDQDYWDIKAHKGGKGSIIVGNVRDVEIMISGARSAVPYYDIILRTGAWGKDIVVPTAIAAAATAGIAAAPVAAIEAYRAHSFEKKFWEFISTTISDIGKGEAVMSSPVAITVQRRDLIEQKQLMHGMSVEPLLQQRSLVLVIPDDKLDLVVMTIKENAKAGEAGDGAIAASDLENFKSITPIDDQETTCDIRSEVLYRTKLK